MDDTDTAFSDRVSENTVPTEHEEVLEKVPKYRFFNLSKRFKNMTIILLKHF